MPFRLSSEVARVIDDRQQLLKSHFLSCALALFVSCFHCNAGVWPCRIDGTPVVGFEKRTRLTLAAGEDQAASKFFLELKHQIPQGVCIIRFPALCNDQRRFTHHVEVVGFNNQRAVTARTAMVTFVSRHWMTSIPQQIE
jgi:hypothetical protein